MVKLIYTKSNNCMNSIITENERERIKIWCTAFKVPNYTINNDGTVDVIGDVDLCHTGITSIDVTFNYVSGLFAVSHNSLETLIGSPSKVGGSFMACGNSLTTLEGCPSHIGGVFSYMGNNIENLYYFPTEIGSGIEDCYAYSDSNTVILEDILPTEKDARNVYLKYMNDYDVWEPNFNEENSKDLLADISDGLL